MGETPAKGEPRSPRAGRSRSSPNPRELICGGTPASRGKSAPGHAKNHERARGRAAPGPAPSKSGKKKGESLKFPRRPEPRGTDKPRARSEPSAGTSARPETPAGGLSPGGGSFPGSKSATFRPKPRRSADARGSAEPRHLRFCSPELFQVARRGAGPTTAAGSCRAGRISFFSLFLLFSIFIFSLLSPRLNHPETERLRENGLGEGPAPRGRRRGVPAPSGGHAGV